MYLAFETTSISRNCLINLTLSADAPTDTDDPIRKPKRKAKEQKLQEDTGRDEWTRVDGRVNHVRQVLQVAHIFCASLSRLSHIRRRRSDDSGRVLGHDAHAIPVQEFYGEQ